MVELPHGKMKSREGTVVDADTLFEELKELAREEILERYDEEPENIDHMAEVIGMGSIKFTLLKVNPKTTMKFDPEAAVNFTGDTGAYLQYAYARINSIERKAAEREVAETIDFNLLGHPKERDLAMKCMEYGTIMQRAARDLDTGCLANYLLELAKLLSSFYPECPVVKDETSPELCRARLELIKPVKAIIKDGLSALTIETLERM